VVHQTVFGGTSDSVRCPRLADGEPAALGKRQSCMLIIRRTVRWCTGLFGESSAMNSSLSRKGKGDVAIIHRCTELSSEPTALAANGRPRDQRATLGMAMDMIYSCTRR
jgi:hypothetical protein